MGIFDTVRALVDCPHCGEEAIRPIQFKHAGHRMAVYEIGEFVQGAPAGRPLLKTSFSCDCSSTTEGTDDEEAPQWIDCWIHLDRGFITDVTTEQPQRPTQREEWMIEQAGWNAQAYSRILQGIGSMLRHRRETIEEAERGELPDPEEAEGFRELHRIRSEEQLLEDLESKLSEVDRWLWPMQRGRGGL